MRVRARTARAGHANPTVVDPTVSTYATKWALVHLTLSGRTEDAAVLASDIDAAMLRLSHANHDEVRAYSRQVTATARQNARACHRWARFLRARAHLMERAPRPAIALVQLAAESRDPVVRARVDAWLAKGTWNELWLRGPIESGNDSTTLLTLPVLEPPLVALAAGAPGYLTTVDADGEVVVWRLDTGTAVHRVATGVRSPRHVLATPGSRVAFVVTDGRDVHVWTQDAELVVHRANGGLPRVASLRRVGSACVLELELPSGASSVLTAAGSRWCRVDPATGALGPMAAGTLLERSQRTAAHAGTKTRVRSLVDGTTTTLLHPEEVLGVSELATDRIVVWGRRTVRIHDLSNGAFRFVDHVQTRNVEGVDRVDAVSCVAWLAGDADLHVLRTDGTRTTLAGVRPPPAYKVTQPGDTWSLGDGRVLWLVGTRSDATLSLIQVPDGSVQKVPVPPSDAFGGRLSTWFRDAVCTNDVALVSDASSLRMWSLNPLSGPVSLSAKQVSSWVLLEDTHVALLQRDGTVRVIDLTATAAKPELRGDLREPYGDCAVDDIAFVSLEDDGRVTLISARTGATIVKVETAHAATQPHNPFGEIVPDQAGFDALDSAVGDMASGSLRRFVTDHQADGGLTLRLQNGETAQWVRERPTSLCDVSADGAVTMAGVHGALRFWAGGRRLEGDEARARLGASMETCEPAVWGERVARALEAMTYANHLGGDLPQYEGTLSASAHRDEHPALIALVRSLGGSVI